VLAAQERCIHTQHVLGLVFGCTGPHKKGCIHTQHVLGLVFGCTGPHKKKQHQRRGQSPQK
jgi:hypothetical protein